MLWLLKKSIGVSGLNGIDKLLSFVIVYEMKNILKVFLRQIDKDTRSALSELYRGMGNLDDIVPDYFRIYTDAKKK